MKAYFAVWQGKKRRRERKQQLGAAAGMFCGPGQRRLPGLCQEITGPHSQPPREGCFSKTRKSRCKQLQWLVPGSRLELWAGSTLAGKFRSSPCICEVDVGALQLWSAQEEALSQCSWRQTRRRGTHRPWSAKGCSPPGSKKRPGGSLPPASAGARPS